MTAGLKAGDPLTRSMLETGLRSLATIMLVAHDENLSPICDRGSIFLAVD